MIDVSREGTVAVVKLDSGVTNALSMELVQRFALAIEDIRSDSEIGAVVLSSTNEKFFSIGFNIPELFWLSRPDFEAYYRTVNQVCLDLYMLPKPTIAAVVGHAIAGGCILALCCDYRVIAAGRKLMGLNEIKLGVPVPHLADCVLRDVVGSRIARDMSEMGEFYPALEALEMGLVDEVVAQEEVLPRAIELGWVLGGMPAQAYELTKRNRVERVEKQIREGWEERRRRFVDCWYSEDGRERLRDAMERF